MKNKKVGSVIVMDKESQPLGIITERDIVKRVCLKNLGSKQNKSRRNYVFSPNYDNAL